MAHRRADISVTGQRASARVGVASVHCPDTADKLRTVIIMLWPGQGSSSGGEGLPAELCARGGGNQRLMTLVRMLLRR